jgi:hypothetical protein
MTALSDAGAFTARWNTLARAERIHVRRMVRMGRPVDAKHGELAHEYAKHQAGRPWIRFFWVWFVPGMVLVLEVATQMHPLLVGVTLALGAQAVWAWFNLRKAARAGT